MQTNLRGFERRPIIEKAGNFQGREEMNWTETGKFDLFVSIGSVFLMYRGFYMHKDNLNSNQVKPPAWIINEIKYGAAPSGCDIPATLSQECEKRDLSVNRLEIVVKVVNRNDMVR